MALTSCTNAARVPDRDHQLQVQKPMVHKPPVHNPYAPSQKDPSRKTRWLKGNIHVHTVEPCDDSIAVDRIHGLDHDAVIQRSQAEPFCFDFVCTSVHPYLNNIELFSRGEQRDDFVVISGREIQNNNIDDGAYLNGYFAGLHARFLHVLSMGQVGGVSICAHPNFFETTFPREGGEWSCLKQALLNPCHRLAELDIMGLEVYNGLSMLEENAGAIPYFPHMGEPCWDDLLCEGVRCAGFAGNDEFYREHYVYENYAPLGFIMVEAALNEADILRSVKSNRFYASTGVLLADTPLVILEQTQIDHHVIRVTAQEAVQWKAMVQRDDGDGFELVSLEAPGLGEQWELTLEGRWKYIRFQAQSINDPLHRAWLQPIYGLDWVDHVPPHATLTTARHDSTS